MNGSAVPAAVGLGRIEARRVLDLIEPVEAHLLGDAVRHHDQPAFLVIAGDVLMVAHMNAEAVAKTIESGEAWYYSRSRKALWKKGETSGNVQRVIELRVDCDQDALWLKVEQQGGGACHTGRRSCFYRAVPLGQSAGGSIKLELRDAEKVFDPREAYGGKPADNDP